MTARGRALGVVLVGTFMGGLDTYITNLALPTIARALKADIGAVEWILLAYLLAITGLVVTFGRASDVYGTQPVFTTGLATFTMGSALAGLAPDIWWLVAARGVQGLGSAMMLAAGQAIVAQLFPEGQRGRAFGWLHVAVSAGFATGPSVGAYLVDQLGWRAVFFVNVPIGVLAVLAAAMFLPRGSRRQPQPFDLPGAATLTLGLVALLLGLTSGPKLGWGSAQVMGSLLGAAGLLAMFVAVEQRAAQPIIDFALFRRWPFTAGLLAAFLTFVAMASNMFLVPFLLQQLLALPLREAGLVMIAVPLTILCVAPIGGYLADRVGPRLPATAGLGLVTAAIVLMAGLPAGTSAALAAAVLALYGAGAGLFQAPNNSATVGAAPPEHRGVASGTLATMRQLGQVVGVAVAGGLWVGRQGVYRASHSPEAALALGFRDAFLALALIGAIAALISSVRGGKLAARKSAQRTAVSAGTIPRGRPVLGRKR